MGEGLDCFWSFTSTIWIATHSPCKQALLIGISSAWLQYSTFSLDLFAISSAFLGSGSSPKPIIHTLCTVVLIVAPCAPHQLGTENKDWLFIPIQEVQQWNCLFPFSVENRKPKQLLTCGHLLGVTCFWSDVLQKAVPFEKMCWPSLCVLCSRPICSLFLALAPSCYLFLPFCEGIDEWRNSKIDEWREGQGGMDGKMDG